MAKRHVQYHYPTPPSEQFIHYPESRAQQFDNIISTVAQDSHILKSSFIQQQLQQPHQVHQVQQTSQPLQPHPQPQQLHLLHPQQPQQPQTYYPPPHTMDSAAYLDSINSYITESSSNQNSSMEIPRLDYNNTLSNPEHEYVITDHVDTMEEEVYKSTEVEGYIYLEKADGNSRMEPIDPGNGIGHDPPTRKKTNKSDANKPSRGNYNTYVEQQISELFRLVFREKIRVAVAARIVRMNSRTAQRMVKEHKANKESNPLPTRRNQKKRGPAPALKGEHSQFLDEYFDRNPNAVLDEAVNAIKSRFNDLVVSKTTVYNHITHRCKNTLRRAHRTKEEACSNAILEKRYIWATEHQNKSDGFKSRSIFIGDAEFFICSNKPSELLSKKRRKKCSGDHRRIMVIGAFSNDGVICTKTYVSKSDLGGGESSQEEDIVAHPQHHGSIDDSAKENFMNFIEGLMGDLAGSTYAQENFNIVIDESLVQHPKRVIDIVTRRGFHCIFLPPGSRFLNPTEECWSKIKAKCQCSYSVIADIINERILEAARTIGANEMESWINQSLHFIPLLIKKELKP